MKTMLRKTLMAILLLATIVITGATGIFAVNAATTLKITKQPVSVVAVKGDTAKVSLTAKGDGLTYMWYYKNKGSSKFSLTTTITGKTYSVKMNKDRAGRQVYCKITDKKGNSVKTKTATLYGLHQFVRTVQKQPKW